jgi:hypothetical protein
LLRALLGPKTSKDAALETALDPWAEELPRLGPESEIFKRFKYVLNGDYHMAVCQNLVPMVNIKIAGKWMFIPQKMD